MAGCGPQASAPLWKMAMRPVASHGRRLPSGESIARVCRARIDLAICIRTCAAHEPMCSREGSCERQVDAEPRIAGVGPCEKHEVPGNLRGNFAEAGRDR